MREPRVARVAGAGGWLPAHQGSSLGLAWCLTGVSPISPAAGSAAVASRVDVPQWSG